MTLLKIFCRSAKLLLYFPSELVSSHDALSEVSLLPEKWQQILEQFDRFLDGADTKSPWFVMNHTWVSLLPHALPPKLKQTRQSASPAAIQMRHVFLNPLNITLIRLIPFLSEDFSSINQTVSLSLLLTLTVLHHYKHSTVPKVSRPEIGVKDELTCWEVFTSDGSPLSFWASTDNYSHHKQARLNLFFPCLCPRTKSSEEFGDHSLSIYTVNTSSAALSLRRRKR